MGQPSSTQVGAATALPAERATPQNPKWYRTPGFRAVAMLVLLGAIAFFARDHLHFIHEGWIGLREANNWWIAAAALTMGLSMVAQSEVMVILLRSAGVPAPRWRTNSLGLAANSWSATFPGGPAISAAMIFREQIKWGATPVIASWYMILSGALAGAGMAILAIGAVFFLGAKVSWMTISLALVALAAIAGGANWLARHPNTVERFIVRVLARFNRWRNKPEDRFAAQFNGLAEQLAAVRLPLPQITWAMVASMLNWILEIACLLACAYAVGAEPPIAGVVLSFLSAKLAGQAQLTPGGLGTVDVTLTSTLVALATLTINEAVSAVIVYRMISFVALTLIGWVVYFLGQFHKVAEEAS